MGLTVAVTYSIIKVMAIRNNKMFSKTLYRQSDIHNVLNKIYPLRQASLEKKEKPYCKFRDNALDTVRVIILDDKAYWIFNNTFYIAQTDDGNVLPETAEPINTSVLSKEEVKKMLSILDSLISGGSNDSGGSGK